MPALWFSAFHKLFPRVYPGPAPTNPDSTPARTRRHDNHTRTCSASGSCDAARQGVTLLAI